ncbi:Inositol hexakisphosphate kinase 1 [Toxocara canis]|uniref:Kinase n=1 Tax=Toxocara canis TaxID=6265 RepID=A0A0B2W2R6_TOXCA|nr:Inositol hexakisphosphate kinase 1 [Toxocara canis]
MVANDILNSGRFHRVKPESQLLVMKKATSSDDLTLCRDSDAVIYLSPFRHQVGGHAVMLCPDQFHICKPYIEREANFYRKMPKSIAEYTPAFCGEMQVKVGEKCGRILTKASTSSVDGRKSCTLCSDGDSFVCKIKSYAHQMSMEHKFRDIESGLLNEANPWSVECQMRTQKANKHHNIDAENRYIILENIAHQFRYPCVLDLKMGTRQYGDGVSEKKRLNFLRKCERSTSKKYGVRVGGMQYFDISTSIYQCVNKYYGESLNFYEMRNLLIRFLHCASDSDRCRILRNSVHKKLVQLHKALSGSDGCRLFSASLLIVYDGDPELVSANSDNKGRVEVRLVDFAHSTCENMNDEVRYAGPDSGILLGIHTLISVFASPFNC